VEIGFPPDKRQSSPGDHIQTKRLQPLESNSVADLVLKSGDQGAEPNIGFGVV
jgi:hypothetical protein